jgi:hypothetical protein
VKSRAIFFIFFYFFFFLIFGGNSFNQVYCVGMVMYEVNDNWFKVSSIDIGEFEMQ